MNGEHRPTRRNILRGAMGLVGLASAGAVAPVLAQQATQQGQQRTPQQGGSGAARGRNANSRNRVLPGMQIVLLGTRGGPGVDLTRAQTSTAVVVDGVPYIVDCGYGALRNMVGAGIATAKIEKMVFTHLHNDHTADLPALLTLQYTNGRTKPIDLYGPFDTEALVRSVIAYCEIDAGIRAVDEGRTTNPAALYRGHNVKATSEPLEIFSDERVKASTVQNTHYPEHTLKNMPYRSIGVRFDSKDRSVVISGDTNYSKNLVKLARDADVFICEIMEQSVRDRWLAQLKAHPDLANHASIGRHVSETHATPEDVGRMAAEANVKLLVLNHQLTSAGKSTPLATLLEAVRKHYHGEVVLGDDQMMI